MEKLDVAGDGLCFFRAVAQGMSHADAGVKLSETEEQDQARLLREACNAFLYDHPGLIVTSQEYLTNERHFYSNGRYKMSELSSGFNMGQRRSTVRAEIVREANARIRRTQWQRGSSVQWADELDISILSFILSRKIDIYNRYGYSSTIEPVFPTHFTNKPIAVFHTPELHYDAYVVPVKHPTTPMPPPQQKPKKKQPLPPPQQKPQQKPKKKQTLSSQSNNVARAAFRETLSGNVIGLGRLLNEGVNPDATNAEGMTLLMVASSVGSAGCLNLLIKYGAKLDVRHKPTGNTALTLAVKNHCMACVKLLLTYWANPRIRNANGRNALTIATAQQNAHIREYITEHLRLHRKKRVGLK